MKCDYCKIEYDETLNHVSCPGCGCTICVEKPPPVIDSSLGEQLKAMDYNELRKYATGLEFKTHNMKQETILNMLLDYHGLDKEPDEFDKMAHDQLIENMEMIEADHSGMEDDQMRDFLRNPIAPPEKQFSDSDIESSETEQPPVTNSDDGK